MQITSAAVLLKGLCQAPKGEITAVVSDSRLVQPGCVFVCFEGARVDGHTFAKGAVEKGAAYIVATHPVEGVPAEQTILVADPALAMVAMASNYRNTVSPLSIGVTGSVGKTTTKQFCGAVMQAFGPTVITAGNQNNDIGMPNTLFRITDHTQYAVVEMGMSNLGEIHRLACAARPHAGIITCIGVSHLQNLGSRENIRKAKLEICDGLPDGAPLVLNADDELLRKADVPDRLKKVWVSIQPEHAAMADVWAENVVTAQGGQSFTLCDRQNGDFAVHIPTLGLHNVRNALQAYAAATRLGLDAARCAAALGDYESTGLRQLLEDKGGVTLYTDCYNASPDSMLASLQTFAGIKANRHMALLGDMLELGTISRAAHEQLGRLCAQHGICRLFAFGEQTAFTAQEAEKAGVEVQRFTDRAEAAEAIRQCLQPGDALLVKGSRGMKLEEITALVWPKEEQGEAH